MNAASSLTNAERCVCVGGGEEEMNLKCCGPMGHGVNFVSVSMVAARR